MFGEAELAFSYFYVCQKNDKYDEAIRYIYHGYVNLNAHNESLLHYIEHHLDERVEEKEFIPFKESFSSLAFDINTICGLINIVPKFEDMEDEFEDVEDKRGYRSLHFANEIGYNIELVHDMAKLLISNNANSVLIDKIRAIMHVMKSYNETSRLIARSGFNGGILGHDDSNEIIFLSVEKGITRMKERLPELENLAGLCSVEADNVLWNPAPTLESKENGQVITVNLRDFQKQTGGHVNLLRDLEQQLPGNPIQLKPARHRKNGVSNLKRSLRSKGYEELANQIRQEKVGSHYEVVCKIRIKLKE